MNKDTIESSQNFFVRCWQGSARLWQAFWLVGVLGKLLVVTVAYLGSFMILGATQNDTLVFVFFIPLLLSYFLFAVVSIWRCARNTHHSFWGVVARVLVLVVALVWILAAWQTF